MQLFHIISVVVPLAIAFAFPGYIRTQDARALKNRAVLYSACFLFFVSWYLPSPLIDGQDTSFVTHFIGGGVFCSLLGLYLYRALQLKWSLLQRLIAVFALVSSLGVLSELFEFLLVKTHLASILLTDTSWDLVANTSGALVTWVVIEIILYVARR